MEALAPAIPERLRRDERRSFRLLRPRVQLRLAAYVLVLSFGFAILFALNSWAAYSQIFDATMRLSIPGLVEEIAGQTRSYVGVSVVLLAGYTIAVVAMTIAFLHRVLGPTVALERHVKALEEGNYGSRLSLRDADVLYHELETRLNNLATRLETNGRKRF